MKNTILILLTFLGIQLSTKLQAQEEVIKLSSIFSVSDAGSATYSIPITLPPGIGGMKPELTLNYSSNGTNGLLGIGWGFTGFSVIARGSKTIEQDGLTKGIDFTYDDSYYLDGERLVLWNEEKEYGKDGAQYGTETNSFIKIVSKGVSGNGPEYFEAYTKTGLKLTFGGNDGSKIFVPGSQTILYYLLNKIEEYHFNGNSNPNYIIYEYYKDENNATYRPNRIRYTLNDNLAPGSNNAINDVSFIYEDRNDINPGYINGLKTSLTKRVKEVQILHNNALKETYSFQYQEPQSTLLLLNSIQHCVVEDNKCSDPIEFVWNYSNTGLDFTEVSNPIPISEINGDDKEIINQDLNNDGLTDLIIADRQSTLSVKIFLNTGNANFINIQHNIQNTTSTSRLNFIDVNADGFVDLVALDINGNNIWYINNKKINSAGALFELAPQQIPPQELDNTSSIRKEFFFIDFNGDARQDFFITDVIDGHRILYENRSDENNSVLFEKTNDIVHGLTVNDVKDYHLSFVDLNNDGRTDVLLNRRNGQETNGHNIWYKNIYTPENNFIFQKVGEDIISRNYFKTDAISIGGGLSSTYATTNWACRDNATGGCLFTRYALTGGVGIPEFTDVNGDGLIDIIIYQFHSETTFSGNNDAMQCQQELMYLFINKGNFTFEPVINKSSSPINLGINYPDYDNFTSNAARCYTGFVNRTKHKGDQYNDCGSPVHDWYANTGVNSPWLRFRDNDSYFVDLNSDGKSDMISKFIYKGNHGGFAGKLKKDLYINSNLNSTNLICEDNEKLIVNPENHEISFGRFYKFGTDIFLYNIKDGANKILRNNADGRPPVIVSFIGHLGGDISVEYVSLNDGDVYTKGTDRSYPNVDFSSSSFVVKNFKRTEIDLSDISWSVPKTTQDISYKYSDGVINLTGRGFRGYKKLEITDNLQGFKTVKEYEEDSRLIASNLKSQKTFSSSGALLSEENYLNVQWQTSSDGSGESDTFFVFTYSNFQDKIFTPYPAETTSRTYDLNGQLLVENKSRLHMDAFGNVIYQVFEYGDGCVDSIYHEYQNDWDNWSIGRLTKSTVFKSCPGTPSIVRESAFEYSPTTGLLVKEILEPNQPDLIRTEKNYEHDMFGNIIKTIEKAWNGTQVVSRVKEVKYDVLGRFQIETINQEGHKVSLKVDPYRGLPTESTDQNGLVTKMKYNSHGILREVEYPDGTKSFYNSEKPLTFGTDGVGMRLMTSGTSMPESNILMGMSGTEYTSEITLFNGEKSVANRLYNTSYRLEYASDPVKSNYYEYDEVGRLISLIESNITWQVPTIHTTLMQFDGLTDITVNPIGQLMTKIKDVRQRLTKTKDNDNNEISYKYDVQGNLSEVICGNNEYRIKYEYDIRGRLISMTDPVLGREEYKYDGFGNLLSQKDGNENIISYSYDNLNRVISVTQEEGTILYTYDQGNKAIGQLSKINYSNYVSNLTYDNLSRLSQNSITIDNKTYLFKYSYNSIGKLDKLEHPSGITLKYHYNNQFYLYKITNNQNEKLFWELNEVDSKNRPTKITLGNGVTSLYTYDFKDNITSIVSTKDTSVITELYFEYNDLSLKTYKWDGKNNFSESYEYDGLNRLTKVISSGSIEDELSMTYDKWGNITSKSDLGTYQYNTQIPTLLEKIDFNSVDCNLPSARFDYEYTSFNKIKKITGDSTRLEIEYGPDNQRLLQRLYVHDQLIESRTYVSNDFEIISLASTEIKRLSVKSVLGATVVYEVIGQQSGKYNYLHKDDQGSIVAITNDQGTILHSFIYDVWGKRKNLFTSDSNTSNTYRGFTGHEHIVILELVNMNGRIYDPVMARFLSPDPYIQDNTNFQNYNRFAYVSNNPVNLVDPSGYFWDEVESWGEELWDEAKSTYNRVANGISQISNGNIRDGLKNFGQAWIDINIKWASGGKVIDQEGRKQFGDETWNQIVVASATIVVGIATGGTGAAGTVSIGTAIMSGMAAGATGGALSAYLGGAGTNDILKAGFRGGAIGGVSAGLTYGVGSGMDAYYGQKGMQTFAGEALRAVGHGAVQGTMNELQGGKFSQGFFTGMVSSIGSHAGNLYGTDPAVRVFSASLVGGAVSSITGGKFATGAVTGAFVEMYNFNAHRLEASLKLMARGALVATAGGIAMGSPEPFTKVFAAGIVLKGAYDIFQGLDMIYQDNFKNNNDLNSFSNY